MASSRVVRLRSRGRERGEGDDGVAAELARGIEQIQAELEVTADFPPEVEQAASAAAAAPRLPELDRTDIELLTIDPPSARDLDQALHVERDGDGYVVHYAIADVAAFVAPGDPVDEEAQRRGETLYGADAKVPLHPTVLSEDAASLLPGQDRPALLWTIRCDETGEGTDVQVERALVRSREQLDYETAQRQIDDGSAPEALRLLREVGELRLHREAARGGVSLPLPEQQVELDGDAVDLAFRSMLPVEQWTAQISLLTGFAAASLMVYARVGLLRTLPPPDPRDVKRLHRTARALGIEWPAELIFPDFIRGLDVAKPQHAAMIAACTRLLRGSGYVAFDGEVPGDPQHAALASEYAHVTAPLRRLGDRYAGEVCVALCAGEDVPGWVTERLHGLPGTLQQSAQRSRRYERAVLDLVEAALLRRRVGEQFPGVIVEVDDDDHTRGSVTVADPAIDAPVRGRDGDLPLGEEVVATLTEADVHRRRVEFTVG